MDQKILDDLEERGLKPVAFICERKEGGLQLMGYAHGGLANFISEPILDGVRLYGQSRTGGGMYSLGVVGNQRPPPEKEEKDDK